MIKVLGTFRKEKNAIPMFKLYCILNFKIKNKNNAF